MQREAGDMLQSGAQHVCVYACPGTAIGGALAFTRNTAFF